MIFLPPQEPPAEIQLAQIPPQARAIEKGMKLAGCNEQELALAETVWLALQMQDFNGLILYTNVRIPNDMRIYRRLVTNTNARGIKVALVVCSMNPPGSYYETSGKPEQAILGKRQSIYLAGNLHGGWVRVWVQR